MTLTAIKRFLEHGDEVKRAVHGCVLFLLAVLLLTGCKRQPTETAAPAPAPEEFLRLMSAGRNHFEQADWTNALSAYKQAVALAPGDLDVHLNLANAYLAGNDPDNAVREADEALKIEPNSAAAWFLKGSANLRLQKHEEAVKAFENAKRIEPMVTATYFQLGLSRMGLKQWEEAITAFREGLATDPNHLHANAHYLLAQSLIRAGRPEEAERELQEHQAGIDAVSASGPGVFERCKYTQPRVPFKLEQPDAEGIQFTYVDATKEVLGDGARFAGPVGVIDLNHNGWNSLFVRERSAFRLLINNNGVLQPSEDSFPVNEGARYNKVLVGDLQNDRFEDVIVLGDKGSHLFKFATNGIAIDLSPVSRLSALSATDGLLIDLDFTGKLDLVAVGTDQTAQLLRQFGPLLFSNITANAGIPASLVNARAVTLEDWNRDGNMDLIVSRAAGAPLLLEKQRGGRLVPIEMTNWVAGSVFCAGDFDNDLRPDIAITSGREITICFNTGAKAQIATVGAMSRLLAVDSDNDGWLDLWALGEKVRVWRNRGLAGWAEMTGQYGLDKFDAAAVEDLRFLDLDRDCDSDVVVSLVNAGLRYLRNDGGNANAQVKVQLFGNRSNASGLGCKVEIEAGGLRLLRTVQQLPVEVGIGKRDTIDSFLVHWFNWPQGSVELPVDCKEPIFSLEQTIQEGSCPYLYAWNGERFEFVTDILGAAPLGLPIAENHYVEPDPTEFVWIGNDQTFVPRSGFYEIQITEELREVLYLDYAELVFVDRLPGTEVHPTDKLLPGKPFPDGTLVTLGNEHPLKSAQSLDGRDVTSLLEEVDQRRLSPPALRAPQLRGLAEPYGVMLDFGPLDVERPLVLVLNGWLRFGGGMANIAASHDPSLPFPFPMLEAETEDGSWHPVDVVVGAPAGKTKTILVDLENKLPLATRRLRLTQAFEIHWDRIALLEKFKSNTVVTVIQPAKAHLHFRGFSAIRDLPDDWPLTPDYAQVSPNSPWTIIPEGWCTRYGDVSELILKRDSGLAVLNSGDELTLRFPANLSPKPTRAVREFFLYAVGWDKDSDFHVAAGTKVGPLPFHDMDAQRYGQEERPQLASDSLHEKYNTRWVDGRALKQVTGLTESR